METLIKHDDISKIFGELIKFSQNDEEIKPILESQYQMFSTKVDFQTFLITFVLEGTDTNGKKVIDRYKEQQTELNPQELSLLDSLNNSRHSVFQVKKINKNGFELADLVNEKEYNVLSFTKMTNFRGISTGNFIVGRIFNHNGTFYILEINNVFTESAAEYAYRSAVVKQMENPEAVYEDNPEKFEELKRTIKEMHTKFLEFFGIDEIITTTEYADDILESFNEFVESGEKPEDINELIKSPESFAYFDVKEVTDGINDLSDAATKGFASHEKIYDVGILYTPETGLTVLPFYGTFKEIFKQEDYKSVPGYEDCIKNYIRSEKISPNAIKKVYNEYKDNFIKVVSDVLNMEGPNFDIEQLLKDNKSNYNGTEIFSSPTVLYCSSSFSKLMDLAKEEPDMPAIAEKVGRNDPCPCGSGKKYKKCCLK